MYYYELHEGDEDLFSDLLLAREEEMPADEFLDTVQAVRSQIQDTFEHDTLIEAIGAELERNYGFVAIIDARLTASVHLGDTVDETYLTEIDEEADGADYRGVLADLDIDGRFQN